MKNARCFRLTAFILAMLLVLGTVAVSAAAEPIRYVFPLNTPITIDLMNDDLRAALDSYYGNTSYTAEQLNADLTVSANASETVLVIPVDSGNTGIVFSEDVDGNLLLLVGIEVRDAAAADEDVAISLFDQNGWSYEQVIDVMVGNMKVNAGVTFGGVGIEVVSTPTPNSFILSAPAGSSLDVSLDVSSLDGTETVLVDWYTMNMQTANQTILSPEGNTSQTFTFENLMSGVEYGWIATVPSGVSSYHGYFYVEENANTGDLIVQASPVVSGTAMVDYRKYDYSDSSYSFEVCAEAGSSLTYTLNYAAADGTSQVYVDWWSCDAYEDPTEETKQFLKKKDTAQTFTFTNLDQDMLYGWDAYIENGKPAITSTVYVYHPSSEEQLLPIYSEGIDYVSPELLTDPALDTPDEISAVISQHVKNQAAQQGLDVSTGGVKVYNVELFLVKDNGFTFEKATEENWPKDGKVTVKMAYPEGCTKDHQIVVAHMFSENAFGKKAGDVEYPTVRKFDEIFEFDVTGLSPISVAWSKPKASASGSAPVEEDPAPVQPQTTAPKTGDETPVALLSSLMAISAAAVIILFKKRSTAEN